MAALPHQTIGRYELRKEIGRGMMGVVYEAFDPALARTIALKTIKLSFHVGTEDLEGFEARFFAEARIAARLSHPGIVVVHDVGRDAQTGTLYIAMERLHGRNLADVITDGVALEARAALAIVARLAEALHHAHGQGVVHRDLKPANVMLLPSGEPKILDFGIAKMETARVRLTSDGQFFGTPLYMSPEQAQGHDLGPRSDLFSLGAVAFNLLTGQAAFAADSIPAIMRRVIEDEPPPPSYLVPSLPPGVDEVIGRALAKSPSDRYPDGRTLANDVKRILGEPTLEGVAAALSAPSHPRPPLVGVATRPGGDLEDELETLVSGLTPLTDPDASGSAPLAPSTSPPTGRRWILVLALAGAAAVVALGVSAYFLWPYLAPRRTPQIVVSPPALPPPLPTPLARTPPPPARPAGSARLALDFEHPLQNGQLTVWVDGTLALDQDLEGRPGKKLVAIKIHKGRFEKTLEVRPGRRRVRVRVAWDDNIREGGLTASFRADSTRRMEVRLGRIRKNLSLEWK
jgi:serine/threonine-protein kinase